jgi:hypothetical protein
MWTFPKTKTEIFDDLEKENMVIFRDSGNFHSGTFSKNGNFWRSFTTAASLALQFFGHLKYALSLHCSLSSDNQKLLLR